MNMRRGPSSRKFGGFTTESQRKVPLRISYFILQHSHLQLVKVKKIEDCASAVQKTVEDYCKSKESKGMAIRGKRKLSNVRALSLWQIVRNGLRGYILPYL